MKSLHRHLMTAGLAAALGIGAIAQAQTSAPVAPSTAPAAPQAQGERGRMDPARAEQFRARHAERLAQRLEAFKQKLQITSAQEGAWSTWTAAMKPVQFQRGSRDEFRNLTTPERIDRMRTLRAQRVAEMDKRGEATKAFYAALTPEQKKVFDLAGPHSGGGFGGGKHGHGHGGRHWRG